MAGVQAFSLFDITGEVPEKVESLCAWETGLLIGLFDGSLCLLQPESLAEDPWAITHQKKIGRKPIHQLDICLELPSVFTLTDEGVQMHGLPELKSLANVPNTRNSSRMAWNEDKGVLAVACRRRLVVYKLKGGQLVELSNIILPDIALAMGWCGESVCVGFRKDYQLAIPDTGEVVELTTGTPGRDRKPIVTPVPGKQVLVARENVILFFGADGKPIRRPGVNWTEPPYAVVVSGPYIVALTPSMVEVRNLNATARKDVVQMLHLADFKLAAVTSSMNGVIFFAPKLKKQVCRLVPTALTEQVSALADMGEFDDALQLSSLLPDSEREEIEDVLRVRNGIHLFSQGYYDDGLSQFAMRSTRSPLLALKLLPSVAPQHLMKNFQLPVAEEFFENYEEPQEEAAYLDAIGSLLPVLLSHRSRLAVRQIEDKEDAAYSPSMPVIGEDSENEDDFDVPVRPTIGSLHLTDTRIVSRAHRSCLSTLVDTAILKATLRTDDTGKLLQFIQQSNFIDLEEGEACLRGAGRYAELAALYQSHGCNGKGMEILRLISQEPDSLVPPPTGAAADMRGRTGVWSAVRYLSKLGKNDVNVIKEHAGWVLRQDPEAALDVFIWAEQRLSPSIVLPILMEHAPKSCAMYLEAMLDNGDASPEEYEQTLVDTYLRDALANEEMLGPMHKLPGVKELGLMNTLERVKSMKRISSKRMDQVSDANVWSKQNSVEESVDEDEAQKTFESQKPVEVYERLRELVIHSHHIDAAAVLGKISSGKLLELQALLMERMGRLESALEIYLLNLDSLSLAEELCDRVYTQRRKNAKKSISEMFATDQDFLEAGDGYMILLKIYTNALVGDTIDKKQVNEKWLKMSELLSRKRARIDVPAVFSLLPDEVNLGLVMPFLEGGLRALGEQQRNLAIVKNLRMCENYDMKEQLIVCKQRVVSVTTDRACWLCHKRIGNAVVVAYPSDSLAHYACYVRDGQSQK